MLKKNINRYKVSVIIPIFNEEKYIGLCLQSVLKQTHNNIEIIVINDGSTDLSNKIISNYNVRLLTRFHIGPGECKNFAAQFAKGEILVFIDGDMYIDKNYIINIIIPIVNNKCDCTYTTSEFVKNLNNIWSKCWNINNNLPSDSRINPEDKNMGKAIRAISKKSFIKSGGYDSSKGYIDDITLNKDGLIILPVHTAVCYHFNPDSLKDVFLSSRWIGRSAMLNLSFRNVLRYSPLNSIRIALKKIFNGAPIKYLVFKLIFDFGIITGMLNKNQQHNYSK